MKQNSEICLVSMPFAGINEPSIGLSILRSQLQAHGHACEIVYFSLKFAELIGGVWYDFITDSPTTQLLGEWVFSSEINDRQDPEGFIRDVFLGEHADHSVLHGEKLIASAEVINGLQAIRDSVSDFVELCADHLLAKKPKIIGFTSVFQQHVASIALAKRLKSKNPDVIIAFGGPNCERSMGQELIRSYPFIDLVASGEAEASFPDAVTAILNHAPFNDIPGILTRNNVGNQNLRLIPRTLPMDAILTPRYDDFFEQVEKATIDGYDLRSFRVPFETSRGCWWGAKSHCTFCGLNGSSMTYRSKSQELALFELKTLVEEYPNREIIVVDNILDMRYFEHFIPTLATWKNKVDLFYEVKANLKKTQIAMMYEAGVRKVQPGIESLSDSVLKLMGKGVSALQNIQTLKWCREYGINVSWNILWGFSGENPDDYVAMANMMPLLHHLQPPLVATTIRIDRFSPNHDDFQNMGFTGLHPYKSYEYVYGLPEESLRNLAYYFVADNLDKDHIRTYTLPVWEAFGDWRDACTHSSLFYVDKGTHLIIVDTRPLAKNTFSVLNKNEREVYLLCDSIQSIAGLSARLMHLEVQTILHDFESRGLIVRVNESVLSLAVKLGVYQPAPEVIQRLRPRTKGDLQGLKVETVP